MISYQFAFRASRQVTTPSIVFGRDVTRQSVLGGRCEASTGEAELLIDWLGQVSQPPVQGV